MKNIVIFTIAVLIIMGQTVCDSKAAQKGVPASPPKIDSSNPQQAAARKPFSFRGILFEKTIKEQKLSKAHFEETSDSMTDLMGFPTYDTRDLPDIGIQFSQSFVLLIDKKIEAYRGSFNSGNADKLLDMLTEKYGKPSAIINGKKQNMMGATFPFFEAKWLIDGYYLIHLRSISYEIGTGSISVQSGKYIAESILKQLKKDSKAKGNL